MNINGIDWYIAFVDPSSPYLWMGRGYTIGVTDIDTRTVYIADNLNEEVLQDVIRHEICHCFIASYGVLMDIDNEECLCQIVEKFSDEIDYLAEKIYREL